MGRRPLTAIAIALVALFSPAIAHASMADVNRELDRADTALSKARDAKDRLRYERSVAHLNDAVRHTAKASAAAKELTGKKRQRALRRVAARRERNVFLAAQLANSAPAVPDEAESVLAEILGRTGRLAHDIVFGGPPGTLFGPGSILNWPGLIPD